MAVLIVNISLNTIFLTIFLHSIDYITVNGLEYRYPVHILLSIAHLTPIRILIPGVGWGVVGVGGGTLALGGPGPCVGLVSLSLEETFVFQYQLKPTLQKYDSRFRYITNKQRSNNDTPCTPGNCMFRLYVSIGLGNGGKRTLHSLDGSAVCTHFCGALLVNCGTKETIIKL